MTSLETHAPEQSLTTTVEIDAREADALAHDVIKTRFQLLLRAVVL